MNERIYRIVRHFRKSGRNRNIRQNLTLGEARSWCSRPDTKRAGIWFDGYDYMLGCYPKKQARSLTGMAVALHQAKHDLGTFHGGQTPSDVSQYGARRKENNANSISRKSDAVGNFARGCNGHFTSNTPKRQTREARQKVIKTGRKASRFDKNEKPW